MAKTGIQYTGDFDVQVAEISCVNGSVIDITEMISAIDIYEDIGTNAITVTVSFVDTLNLI